MGASLPIIAAAAVIVAAAALAALAYLLRQARRQAQPDGAMADLTRAHAEVAARLEGMIGMLAKGQSQLAHTMNERLDSVSQRLGDSLEKTKQHTVENLQKLNERLAVIDSAQNNIAALAKEVTSLQSVLGNKQERGAFGVSGPLAPRL